MLPFLLAACTPLPPEPVLVSVLPDWGWLGEPTDIVLVGEEFFPNVVVDDAGGRVDAGFRVELGTDPPTLLPGVTLLDYQHLSAEVPAGLEPGRYDLVVLSPAGHRAELPDAFRVSETRADRLVWDTPTVGLEINDYAPVTLSLVDPDGEPVTEPLAVEVQVGSTSKAAEVVFLYDESFEPVPVGIPGVQVYRGTLRADGTADFQVTAIAPDEVLLTAFATEEEAITTGELQLSFGAGSLDRLEIALPEDPFVAQAGESFLVDLVLYDEHGVELGPQPYTILLYDECGSFAEEVDLATAGPVEVTVTRACPSDTLRALGVGIDEAVSAEFRVDPGAVVGYDVRVTPDEVQAGTEHVGVQATALDAWGNAVTDHAAILGLYDDLEGLYPGLVGGYQVCSAFRDGIAACSAVLLRSGEEVTITARDEVGLQGQGAPIRVLPGAPESVAVELDITETYADRTFEVVVGLADAWGNWVAFDANSPGMVEFRDDTDSISCGDAVADGERWLFTCGITAAAARTRVEAEVMGLVGSASWDIEVDNGDLDHGTIELTGDPFTAGEVFDLTVRLFDYYNNPYSYRTAGEASVTLADTTGTLELGTGTLTLTPPEDGIIDLSATIYQAGIGLELRVEQAGSTWVTSRAFTVNAADQVGFELEWPRWVEVDVATDVTVVAVDAYGNAVRDYVGEVAVDAEDGACGSTSVSDFDEGRGRVGVTCDTLALQELLTVVDTEGYEGSSETFDVVDLDCADGPRASLDLDGAASATVCLVAGTVTVSADASGSRVGEEQLTAIHYEDSDGNYERLDPQAWAMDYTSGGTRRVDVLVVDEAACADEASGLVYVGEDDGSATGPITVTPSASAVAAGGTLTVDVAATDCAGDIAAGATLHVRADLGEPAATSTGAGLQLTLDASGVATFDWDFPTAYGELATLSVGSPTGSGQGSAQVEVSGDTARPMVVEVEPAGDHAGDVDEIVVTFTDPMLESNFLTSGSSATISLTGPATAPALTASLDESGKVLTLTPASAIDADLGTWTLRLTLNIRDELGNRLSGDWSGNAADFTVTFGATGVALPAFGGCGRSASTFTPDGDDGALAEADSWSLTPTVSASPSWWWLEVVGEDGARVRSAREVGTETFVTWDGRGDDGRVVETGQYTGWLYGVDTAGNVGLACQQAVTVDQHVVVR